MESNMKIKVWMRETKTPKNIERGERKRGNTSGAIKVRERSIWSAIIFPKRRIESESTRAKWLITSMVKNRGESNGTGPRKCLMYFTPWALIP